VIEAVERSLAQRGTRAEVAPLDAAPSITPAA